jgi:hypothetical protein
VAAGGCHDGGGDVGLGEDAVDTSGGDGGAGHAEVSGGGFVLGEDGATAAWNHNETTLAAASQDGIIGLWPIDVATATRQLCKALTTDFPAAKTPRLRSAGRRRRSRPDSAAALNAW